MQIFIDENLSEYVANALNLLCKGYFKDIEVLSTKNVAELGIGAPDEKIIPYVGQKAGVIVTRDRGVSRQQMQYRLCKENNAIVVFIKLPKKSDRLWDLVKILIKNWEEIIKILRSTKRQSISLTHNGIKLLPQ